MRMRSWLVVGVTILAACSSFDEGNGSAPPPGNVDDAGSDGGSSGTSQVPGQPPDTSFLIDPVSAVVTVVQGKDAPVALLIKRGKNLVGGVDIVVKGLPDGVTASPLSITGTDGTLVLTASAGAAQGSAADAVIEASAGGTTLKTTLKIFVRGAPGALDTTWAAGTGRANDIFGPTFVSGFMALVLGDDDSVYGVGSCNDGGINHTCAVHVLADGTPDTAYGNAGLALQTTSSPHGAALTSDGRLVVVGGEGAGYATIARFAPAGAPDGTFGTGFVGPGTASLGTGGLAGQNLGAYGVAIRKKDGNLFVAWDNFDGSVVKNGSMRLDASGALVGQYGPGGTARSAVGGWSAILVRNDGGATDGNLITAWAGADLSGFLQVAGDTGTVDSTQSQGGLRREVPLLGARRPQSGMGGAVILADGTTVLPVTATPGIYVRAVTRAGDAAPGFGSSGVAGPFALGGEATGIAAQADGKVIVAVEDTSGATGQHIVRFTTAGAIDPDFGDQGHVKTQIGSTSLGRKVVVQKSGRILVAGEKLSPGRNGAVTAYWQ
ncbi:MAG: Hemolysin-type calcium-binding region [Labilithrix sp.]|nr:Hemolysin-type calcium-binding region [Labilithrix sp.]